MARPRWRRPSPLPEQARASSAPRRPGTGASDVDCPPAPMTAPASAREAQRTLPRDPPAPAPAATLRRSTEATARSPDDRDCDRPAASPLRFGPTPVPRVHGRATRRTSSLGAHKLPHDPVCDRLRLDRLRYGAVRETDTRALTPPRDNAVAAGPGYAQRRGPCFPPGPDRTDGARRRHPARP